MTIREIFKLLNQLSRVKVINCVDSSDDTLPHGVQNWTDFWEQKKRKRMPRRCSHCGSTTNVEGAHVTMSRNPYNWDYIVPLCHECNLKGKNTNGKGDLKWFEVFRSDLAER